MSEGIKAEGRPFAFLSEKCDNMRSVLDKYPKAYYVI